MNLSSRDQFELSRSNAVFDMRSQAALQSPYVHQEAVSHVSMVRWIILALTHTHRELKLYEVLGKWSWGFGYLQQPENEGRRSFLYPEVFNIPDFWRNTPVRSETGDDSLIIFISFLCIWQMQSYLQCIVIHVMNGIKPMIFFVANAMLYQVSYSIYIINYIVFF